MSKRAVEPAISILQLVVAIAGSKNVLVELHHGKDAGVEQILGRQHHFRRVLPQPGEHVGAIDGEFRLKAESLLRVLVHYAFAQVQIGAGGAVLAQGVLVLDYPQETRHDVNLGGLRSSTSWPIEGRSVRQFLVARVVHHHVLQNLLLLEIADSFAGVRISRINAEGLVRVAIDRGCRRDGLVQEYCFLQFTQRIVLEGILQGIGTRSQNAVILRMASSDRTTFGISSRLVLDLIREFAVPRLRVILGEILLDQPGKITRERNGGTFLGVASFSCLIQLQQTFRSLRNIILDSIERLAVDRVIL